MKMREAARLLDTAKTDAEAEALLRQTDLGEWPRRRTEPRGLAGARDRAAALRQYARLARRGGVSA